MKTEMGFSDRVAIVTGGTSGIGKTTAIALADAGAKVVLSGRREAEGVEVVAAITAAGGTAAFFRADMSKEGEIQAMVDFAVSEFGRLDGAFNNAGVELIRPSLEVTEGDYRRVFDLNVWGVMASMKYEIAAMLKSGGGCIVNNSSIAGRVGMAGNQIYCASKHAVEGLTKAVALEFARQGIRVNAVAPAGIETQMLERFAPTEQARIEIANWHPVGRIGKPEDVARAVLLLLDPASDFMTGTSIAVDGGYLAQ